MRASPFRLSCFIPALVAAWALPGARAQEPAAADAVKMEQFVVKDSATAASSAMADKAAAATVTEVVSGAALNQATVQDAGDALKGVAGVTVSKASDGSTNVSIRGLAPQFNRVTVDGQRQSNSGRFSGGSALDSLPPEILKSIEVSKSLTPDMDADAIGGVVNLSTANATDLKKGFVQGKELLVYNSLSNKPGVRSSVSVGEPFALWSKKPDAGILLTFNYDELYRPREGIETYADWPTLVSPGPAPYVGAALPAFTDLNFEKTLDRRERSSLLFNADTRLGSTVVFLKSNFTRDARFRTREQDIVDPATGTPLALTPTAGTFSGVYLQPHGISQNSSRQLATVSVGEKSDLGRLHVAATFAVSRAEDLEPHTLDAMLVSQDPFTVSYNTLAEPLLPSIGWIDGPTPGANGSIVTNPARYNVGSLTVTHSRGVDVNETAQVDLKLDLNDQVRPSFLKFGGKVQPFKRTVDQERSVFDPSPGAAPPTAVGLVGDPLVTYHLGGYQFGPTPDPAQLDALVATQPGRFAVNAADTALGSSAADYAVHQTIWAGYGMADWIRGPWSLLAGVRVEGTSFDAHANQPNFAADGTLLGFTPASNARSYATVLPGVHLRYDPEPGLVVRAAVYRSLIRPSYGDLAPYLDINFDQFRVRAGNPALKPYDAVNYDLTGDWYREALGLFSGSFFFKSIRDFQADSDRVVTLGGLGQFLESQKINGDKATVAGVELSWKSNSWALPAGLGQAALALTNTVTQSASRLPGRPGETLPLPQQAREQCSASLQVQRGAFSLETTFTYHTATLDEVVSYDRDRYEEGIMNLDVSVAYKFNKHLTATAGIGNATSALNRAYSGETFRLKEVQISGYELSAGLSWKL